MNYNLLCNIFRCTKEYEALCDNIKAKTYGTRTPISVSGLTDGAEYIFLTCLAKDIGKKGTPLTLVFDDAKKASAFSEFLNSVGLRSVFFPVREYGFLNVAASHDYETIRLEILAMIQLTSPDSPTVICTTPDAMLQTTMPPEMLRSLTLKLDYNSSIETEKLAEKLSEAGYARVDLVESVGQYAVRGGIIDIFPAGGFATRIELFGDEVDRLGRFSVDTQRFTDMLESGILVPPVREIILDKAKREEITGIIKTHIAKLAKTRDRVRSEKAVSVLNAEIATLQNEFDVNFADKYLPTLFQKPSTLLDYLDGTVVIIDSQFVEERSRAARALVEQSLADMTDAYEMPQQNGGPYMLSYEDIISRQSGPTITANTLGFVQQNGRYSSSFVWDTRHVPSYSGNVQLLTEDLQKYTKAKYLCMVLCSTENEKSDLMKFFAEYGYTVANAEREDFSLPEGKSPVIFSSGSFIGGYELTHPRFILMNFSRDASRPSKGRIPRVPKKAKHKATEAILSYADLNVGDIVVHDIYGIGQYMGLETITTAGSTRDYIHITYAGTDKLFIPVDQLDHVSKYIGGGGDGVVKLSKMGGNDWIRAKKKAKESAKEMAKDLIELYARRRRTEGIKFDPDDALSREFADSFEYEETDGQLNAIDDIRRDMEKPYPMDRLLCGDVGYGKTEVALRAAFKAVMSGKQVAVLVPTTILAYQHYQTFQKRFRSFPVSVEMLSSFKSKKENEQTVRKIQRGDCDIAIGTHRILSKDISFNDLGLIIIDEEQRFGVGQKEKLKKLAVNADVLTLTATPIPRTLNMSMGGIVDMSILEEAPGLRSPVQTYVMEFDEGLINEAIRRELRRGGQVFYLHNRIESIYSTANRIQEAVPDARIAVAHGRMDRDEIEDIWEMLVKGEIDILVCTTIIETGVDIPNANTLIIEDADKYGLAQLHQIRGRVGRSSVKAFAYFTYKKGKQLSEISEKRLSAIREYAEFGAGFRIALRDLEIRGAGNLLGAEQHGHLDAVGYDLYIKLLEEAVIEEKGEKLKEELPPCIVDIKCDAYLTSSYIASPPQRMDMYKRIARIRSEEDYDDIIGEMCDRYGEPNSQAVNLCRIARIRALGQQSGLKKVWEENGVIKLYSDKFDFQAIQTIHMTYPTLGVRLIPGKEPYVAMKMKPKSRNTEYLIELLEKYYSAKKPEKSSDPEEK